MIKREYTFPVSCIGTIFDIETTSLETSEGELITIGYFTGNTITIYQRDDLDGSGEKELETIKKQLTVLPRPYMSYMREFEEKWLGFKLDFDLFTKWKDLCEKIKVPGHMFCRTCKKWVSPTEEMLCPNCGDWLYDTIKWPKASELISLPHSYFFKSDIEGKEIPKIWKRYLETKNKKFLEIIIFHNFNDLIRNYCLYLWDESIAKLISQKLSESAEKPRSIYELLMGKKKKTKNT